MLSDDLKFKLIATAGIGVVAYFVVQKAANAGAVWAENVTAAADRAVESVKQTVQNNPVYTTAGDLVPNPAGSQEQTLGSKFWAWMNPDAVAAEKAALGQYNSRIPAESAKAIDQLAQTKNGYGDVVQW